METKVCSRCSIDKPVKEFYRSKCGSQGRHSRCKQCYREYDVRYYAKSKISVRQRSRDQRTQFRKWYWALKEAPCTDCGNRFYPVCMQFDHSPSEEKLFTISAQQNREKVLSELEKCELVCANCHALRTWTRQMHP